MLAFNAALMMRILKKHKEFLLVILNCINKHGNSICVPVLENILTNLFNTGRKKTRREFRLW